jgi:hypothetical protein
MLNVKNLSDAVRALGPERLRLLSVITAGHFVIHWFQQLFRARRICHVAGLDEIVHPGQI